MHYLMSNLVVNFNYLPWAFYLYATKKLWPLAYLQLQHSIRKQLLIFLLIFVAEFSERSDKTDLDKKVFMRYLNFEHLHVTRYRPWLIFWQPSVSSNSQLV